MFKTHLLYRPDGDDGSGGSGTSGTGDADDTGAGTGGDGSQGDDGAGTGTGGDGGTGTDDKELAKARDEAAKSRIALREAQTKLKELEDKGKSDLEKAQELVKTLETQVGTVTDKAKKAIVAVASGDLGIVKEARSDAAALLDWSKIEDPLDEAEVTKALKELVKERPYLLGKAGSGADGGAGGRQKSGTESMNDRIREAAGRT